MRHTIASSKGGRFQVQDQTPCFVYKLSNKLNNALRKIKSCFNLYTIILWTKQNNCEVKDVCCAFIVPYWRCQWRTFEVHIFLDIIPLHWENEFLTSFFIELSHTRTRISILRHIQYWALLAVWLEVISRQRMAQFNGTYFQPRKRSRPLVMDFK